ncbi:MAG: carboxypeptidase M32, partial [Ketobacter sp.]
MAESAYEALEQRFRRISRIAHMLSIGKWDEAVCMPVGGGSGRAAALAELASIRNEMLHDPALPQCIAAAEGMPDLNPWQQANVREIKRIHTTTVAVPLELEEAYNLATLATEQAWRQYRKDNDWNAFQPLLARVVELTRQRAQCLAERFDCDPYEALMQLYQTDFSRQDIDEWFSVLQAELPPLIQKIMARQQVHVPIPISGNFEIAKQQALSRQLMQQLGFDFQHGRLDVTLHPFCGGVPRDVRINTR